MSSLRSKLAFVVLTTIIAPWSVQADVIIWNEAVNGPFSNVQGAPTVLNPVSGDVNSIIGTIGSGLVDWVTLRVPVGSTLNSVLVSSYTPGDGTSFVGFQGGTVFVGDPLSDPTAYLGYTHFGTGPGNLNINLLPEMAIAPGAQGFTFPLAAGDYAFIIRQAGLTTGYEFEFTVSPVPEPSSMILLTMAGFGVAGRRWKARRNAKR